MNSSPAITEALFEDLDGAARDITFTPVSRKSVARFFEALAAAFTLKHAFNSEGEDVTQRIAAGELAEHSSTENGSVHTSWISDSHVISALQAFVCWPEAGDRLFLELTFFPEDLVAERFDLEDFINEIERWAEILGASDYFVRYENASWKEGDPDAPDVIYARSTKPNGRGFKTEVQRQ